MVVQRVLKSRRIRDFALMTAGIVMTAWSLDAFLIPNKIAAGGVSGLSTVIYYWAKGTLGLTIPGRYPDAGDERRPHLRRLACPRGALPRQDALRRRRALSCSSTSWRRSRHTWPPSDLLLAALWGGAIAGIGMGLVFKGGGNTGGTDIVAQLMSRRVPFGVGQIMLVVDAFVIVLAALQFGPNLALYGVVAIFVTTASIDLVLEGVSVEKAVWIISDFADAIGSAINHDMGRGATRLEATGVYTGEKRGTLFVVLARNEIDDLKAIVKELDPTAMVIISNVHEAIGEGFKEMAG